jgi:hypothetical protein
MSEHGRGKWMWLSWRGALVVAVLALLFYGMVYAPVETAYGLHNLNSVLSAGASNFWKMVSGK